MSRVAWELVVVGRGEKYIRFVSDKNLWSAWGWTFIMKECAVGERNVYIEGLLVWRVLGYEHGPKDTSSRGQK